MAKKKIKLISRKPRQRGIWLGIAGLLVFGIVLWVLTQGESDSV